MRVGVFFGLLVLMYANVARADVDEYAIQKTLSEVEKYQSVVANEAHGVVHLTGDAALTPNESQELVKLVQGFDGVRYVDNRVRDQRGFKERMTPALDNLKQSTQRLSSSIPMYILGFVLLVLLWFLSGFVTKWVIRLMSFASPKPMVENLIRQVVRVVVMITGFALVLDILDMTSLVGAVLGSAGIAGLAVGFALRDLVENHIAGLMLSVRRPFEKMDYIQVDSFKGKVIELNTRETILMTLDGNHVRIPNAVIFKSVIYNYTRNPRRRFDFTVDVGSNEDLAYAMSFGLKTIRATDGVLAEPKSFALVSKLGDSTVQLQFYAWVDQRNHDFTGAKSASIRRLKVAFDENGIEMPEPTTRILHHAFDPRPIAHREEVLDEMIHMERQIDEQIQAEGGSDTL